MKDTSIMVGRSQNICVCVRESKNLEKVFQPLPLSHQEEIGMHSYNYWNKR